MVWTLTWRETVDDFWLWVRYCCQFKILPWPQKWRISSVPYYRRENWGTENWSRGAYVRYLIIGSLYSFYPQDGCPCLGSYLIQYIDSSTRSWIVFLFSRTTQGLRLASLFCPWSLQFSVCFQCLQEGLSCILHWRWCFFWLVCLSFICFLFLLSV